MLEGVPHSTMVLHSAIIQLESIWAKNMHLHNNKCQIEMIPKPVNAGIDDEINEVVQSEAPQLSILLE
jgi:hypothetical protein